MVGMNKQIYYITYRYRCTKYKCVHVIYLILCMHRDVLYAGYFSWNTSSGENPWDVQLYRGERDIAIHVFWRNLQFCWSYLFSFFFSRHLLFDDRSERIFLIIHFLELREKTKVSYLIKNLTHECKNCNTAEWLGGGLRNISWKLKYITCYWSR